MSMECAPIAGMCAEAGGLTALVTLTLQVEGSELKCPASSCEAGEGLILMHPYSAKRLNEFYAI